MYFSIGRWKARNREEIVASADLIADSPEGELEMAKEAARGLIADFVAGNSVKARLHTACQRSDETLQQAMGRVMADRSAIVSVFQAIKAQRAAQAAAAAEAIAPPKE